MMTVKRKALLFVIAVAMIVGGLWWLLGELFIADIIYFKFVIGSTILMAGRLHETRAFSITSARRVGDGPRPSWPHCRVFPFAATATPTSPAIHHAQAINVG
jgi:hypothetical protein